MKFHISPKTLKPTECTAGKKPCPLANSAHFDSMDKAQDYIEKTYGENYNILAGKTNEKKESEVLSNQWFSQRKKEYLSTMSTQENKNPMETVQAFVGDDIEKCRDCGLLPQKLDYNLTIDEDSELHHSIAVDVFVDKPMFEDKAFNVIKLKNGTYITSLETSKESKEVLGKLHTILNNYNQTYVVDSQHFRKYVTYEDISYKEPQRGINFSKVDYSSLNDSSLNKHLESFYLKKYEDNIADMIKENNELMYTLGSDVDKETIGDIEKSLHEVEKEHRENYKKSIASTFNLIKGKSLTKEEFSFVDKSFFTFS